MTALAAVVVCLLAQTDDGLSAMRQAVPVPDVLAGELLGATDLKVVRPGDMGAVVTDLAALQSSGTLKPGLALETTPWELGMGRSLTLEQYRGFWTRLFTRASFSVATVSAGTDSKDVRLGVGARVRIIDDSDWRLSSAAVDCLTKALIPPDPPDGGLPADPPVVDETMKAEIKKCRDQLPQNAPWNGQQLAIGAGGTFDAFNADLGKAQAESFALWGSYAHRAAPLAQWLVSLRYTARGAIPTSDGHPGQAHSQLFGAAFELVYRPDPFALFFDFGAGLRFTSSKDFVGEGAVGIRADMRLTTGTTLSTSIAILPTFGSGPAEIVFRSDLKWTLDAIPDKS